jgi:monofunctional biosynthetic peptidoglycan transglycosylase
MKTKGLFQKIWRWTKKIFLIMFIAQFVYIILLKWIDPPITLTQLFSFITGHGLKRDYVDRDEISYNAKLAVIASEDQLFVDHSGFDWKSIKKAMKYNEKKPGRTKGASTISQQVAKNVFLWQGRDWIRKGLEVYLNVIEMGDGIFGIERAANIYFSKSAKYLTRQEAAMIAACLPNPKRYKVKPPSRYVSWKAGKIMQQMNFLQPDPDIQKVIEKTKKK